MLLSRRSLIVSGLFAPAIVRAASIMHVPMLTWREARRAKKYWYSVDYAGTAEDAQIWLETTARDGLTKLITASANKPLYWSDEPWPILKDFDIKSIQYPA
jgi:hypothetical protein